MDQFNSVRFQLLTNDNSSNKDIIGFSEDIINTTGKNIDVSLFNRLYNCYKAGNNCASYLMKIGLNEKRYNPAVKRLLSKLL